MIVFEKRRFLIGFVPEFGGLFDWVVWRAWIWGFGGGLYRTQSLSVRLVWSLCIALLA